MPLGGTRGLGLAAALGVLGGLGGTTLRYAEATSYLSAEPAACANCHIMQPQYDSWQKASHHTAARCVDCHLPTDTVGKYWAKARNGWNHSVAFTLQNFAEPIRIGARNAAVLQRSCLNCHGELVHGPLAAAAAERELRCVHCHAAVGHAATAGLGGPWRPGEGGAPRGERPGKGE